MFNLDVLNWGDCKVLLNNETVGYCNTFATSESMIVCGYENHISHCTIPQY